MPIKYLKKTIELDDINIAIVEELQKNPRESLRTISNKLHRQGISASPETIRKRINSLKGSIEFQLIPNFEVFGFDNAILLIKIHGANGSRKRVIDRLHKINGFGVAETIGEYELTGFIAVKGSSELGKAIDSIKSLREVEDVNYLLITKRHTSITRILNKLKNTN